MARKVSESFVLRTYPLREADLIVSFFTRDQGKLRGTARGARKPKSLFGAGLERLSLVRMHYSQREDRELVTLVSCDLLFSQFALLNEYGATVALDFVAEVAEQVLPDEEPNEKLFRLVVAVLDHLHAHPADGVWPAVTYFSYWVVRLGGYFPSDLKVSAESRELADRIATTPIGQLEPATWDKPTAQDLRRALVKQIERHIEKKLLTVPLLEAL